MTVNQLVETIIAAGAWMDHDVLADDEHGDAPFLRISLGEAIDEDDLSVFEQLAGCDWWLVSPGYGEIRLTSTTFPEILGSDPQAVLNEVARRLQGVDAPSEARAQ